MLLTFTMLVASSWLFPFNFSHRFPVNLHAEHFFDLLLTVHRQYAAIVIVAARFMTIIIAELRVYRTHFLFAALC